MGVVRDACPALTDRTTLLDICCGTGTIGILLAKSVQRVIGVDICPEAIDNARRNATLNGVTNCTYMAAKAEDVIRDVMSTYVDSVPAGGGAAAAAAVDTSGGGRASTSTEDAEGLGSGSGTHGNVVAVVDPPRAGLHKDVVQHIRRHDGIGHLIYISCSLGGARSNIVDFCRATSKKYRGRPFVVKRVIPVDLFPHTDHCEAVLVLEREPLE